MSLAKKCDRCGKLYEHYPKGNKSQCNAIRRVQRTQTGEFTNSCGFPVHDLCPECMSAFDKFMTSGGKFDDKT